MEHGDVDSIRLRGQKIGELPHRERFEALRQIAEHEKEQALRGILDRFPKYDAEQLAGAIKQMEENIKNLQATQVQEHDKIKEYRELIDQCEQRDRALAANGFG